MIHDGESKDEVRLREVKNFKLIMLAGVVRRKGSGCGSYAFVQ